DVGVVLVVEREHSGDDLRLVLEAVDEERPNRTVDEAGGQRFLFGGTAFPFEVAAGDLPCRVGSFLIVHGQREEVHSGANFLLGDDGGEDSRFTILGEHSAIGLASQLPRLESELSPAPFNFYTMNVEHLASFKFESLSTCAALGTSFNLEPSQERTPDQGGSISLGGGLFERSATSGGPPIQVGRAGPGDE